MQGKIAVGEFGAADVGVGGECCEGRGFDGDGVRHGRVMVSIVKKCQLIENAVQKQDAKGGYGGVISMPTYIKIGRGEWSATAVYQSLIPCCVRQVAKNPGASTRPHCAPASLDSCNCLIVSLTPWVAVPAISG